MRAGAGIKKNENSVLRCSCIQDTGGNVFHNNICAKWETHGCTNWFHRCKVCETFFKLGFSARHFTQSSRSSCLPWCCILVGTSFSLSLKLWMQLFMSVVVLFCRCNSKFKSFRMPVKCVTKSMSHCSSSSGACQKLASALPTDNRRQHQLCELRFSIFHLDAEQLPLESSGTDEVYSLHGDIHCIF